jgi:hypothetical protein
MRNISIRFLKPPTSHLPTDGEQCTVLNIISMYMTKINLQKWIGYMKIELLSKCMLGAVPLNTKRRGVR